MEDTAGNRRTKHLDIVKTAADKNGMKRVPDGAPSRSLSYDVCPSRFDRSHSTFLTSLTLNSAFTPHTAFFSCAACLRLLTRFYVQFVKQRRGDLAMYSTICGTQQAATAVQLWLSQVTTAGTRETHHAPPQTKYNTNFRYHAARQARTPITPKSHPATSTICTWEHHCRREHGHAIVYCYRTPHHRCYR